MNINNKFRLTNQSLDIVIPKIELLNSAISNIPKNKLVEPHFRIYPSQKNKNDSKYAYVTIIIINNSYIPAVLALGNSLRKTKTKYKLVCVVQDIPTTIQFGGEEKYYPGITKNQIDDINKIYDEVIGVNLLSVSGYLPKEGHFTAISTYKNIGVYVTKLQVLGLLQYEKFFYIDASCVVSKNIDSVFKKYDRSTFITDYEYQNTKMGLKGGFFFCVPKIEYYNKALYMTYNYEKIFKDLFFVRGIDEVLLYFSIYPEWSDILLSKNFGCYEYYGKVLAKNFDPAKGKKYCKIYYYQMSKPFRKDESRNNTENNQTFVAYKRWDYEVNDVLKKHPSFKKYYKHIPKYRKTWFKL